VAAVKILVKLMFVLVTVLLMYPKAKNSGLSVGRVRRALKRGSFICTSRSIVEFNGFGATLIVARLKPITPSPDLVVKPKVVEFAASTIASEIDKPPKFTVSLNTSPLALKPSASVMLALAPKVSLYSISQLSPDMRLDVGVSPAWYSV
jgi:hypothetical protein